METNNNSIIQPLAAVSRLAREGDYPTAALQFNRCALLLQEHAAAKASIPTNGSDQAKVTYSLQTMLLLLQNKDWVALADVIDYEFIPLWKALHPHNG